MEIKYAGRNTVETVSHDEARNTTLSVVVPYTTPERTAAALRYATSFSRALTADIRLMDVCVVPYPCDLTTPLTSREFLENRLREALVGTELQVVPQIIYARDRAEGFTGSMAPSSVVVIASPRSWWRTAERKLGLALQKAGFQVVMLDCE